MAVINREWRHARWLENAASDNVIVGLKAGLSDRLTDWSCDARLLVAKGIREA